MVYCHWAHVLQVLREKLKKADAAIAELEVKREALERECRDFRQRGLPEARLLQEQSKTPADRLQRWLKDKNLLKESCVYEVLNKVYVCKRVCFNFCAELIEFLMWYCFKAHSRIATTRRSNRFVWMTSKDFATRLATCARLCLTIMQALIAFNLDHPNILPVEGVIYDLKKQEVYVQTHWCAGGDLRTYLKAQADAKRTVDLPNLFRQILTGIAYLQSQKIVHCDIKPENIHFSLTKSTRTRESLCPASAILAFRAWIGQHRRCR